MNDASCLERLGFRHNIVLLHFTDRAAAIYHRLRRGCVFQMRHAESVWVLRDISCYYILPIVGYNLPSVTYRSIGYV